jgi:hypothetical protein
MNVVSGGLLGVAVGYSGWADWEMAGWKLQVGNAVLQYGCDGELDWEWSDVGKQLSVER